jgi:hypothetical protein
MSNRAAVLAIALSVLMVSLAVLQATAGGPPPRPCPPPMCAPPMCPPPMCPPPMCGPPPCPPPMCGPPPCRPPCPPNYCGEFPCISLLKGACKLCFGLVALPFKVCGAVMKEMQSTDECAPYTRLAVAPVPCPMPPMCGPAPGPAMGPGMGYRGPRGIDRRVPRRMGPMGKSADTVEKRLMAAPSESMFGVYW